jgi:hypothetical protein
LIISNMGVSLVYLVCALHFVIVVHLEGGLLFLLI